MSFNLSGKSGVSTAYGGTISIGAGETETLVTAKGVRSESGALKIRGNTNANSEFWAADSVIKIYVSGSLIATITDQIYSATEPLTLPVDLRQARDLVVTATNNSASSVQAWAMVEVL